jgi:hypothetical protein
MVCFLSHRLSLLSLVVILYDKKAKYSPEYTPEDGTDRGAYTHVRATALVREQSSVSSRSVTCLTITARLAPYRRVSARYSALPNSLSSASSVSESSRGISPRVIFSLWT